MSEPTAQARPDNNERADRSERTINIERARPSKRPKVNERNILAILVREHERAQRERIRTGNQLSAAERGVMQHDETTLAILVRLHGQYRQLEDALLDDVTRLARELPIYRQLRAVVGIGPTIAAQMLGLIDIARAQTVSALWRFAGQGLGRYWRDEAGRIVAPVRGRRWDGGEIAIAQPEPEPGWVMVQVRDHPVAGWLLPYNKRLKVTCYRAGVSMLRSGSPYRLIYDQSREHYARAQPDWTDGHAHAASLRRMVKIFLSHLWERWRVAEGLPVRVHYAQEYLGHSTRYTPEEFGWPVAGRREEDAA